MSIRTYLKRLLEIALTKREKRLLRLQRYSTVIESEAGWSSSDSQQELNVDDAKKKEQLRFLKDVIND